MILLLALSVYASRHFRRQEKKKRIADSLEKGKESEASSERSMQNGKLEDKVERVEIDGGEKRVEVEGGDAKIEMLARTHVVELDGQKEITNKKSSPMQELTAEEVAKELDTSYSTLT